MFSVDPGAVLEVSASVAYSANLEIVAMSPKAFDSPVPVVGLQS